MTFEDAVADFALELANTKPPNVEYSSYINRDPKTDFYAPISHGYDGHSKI